VRGQVVDTPTADEFRREILARASEEELAAIAADAERKSVGMGRLLDPPGGARLDRTGLRRILRSVFSTRRSADALMDGVGVERLAAEIDHLLHGGDDLPARLARFDDALAGFPEAGIDLPFELLHFTDPDRYWPWTRWMWDPRTGTGALPLVTMDDVDLGGASRAEVYARVGEAIAFVRETGRAAGFTPAGESPFALDVFLACVYGIYMYTVLRMRMTREFTRVVPELPGLVRRLLGVHRLEV
jgi:hypothetical protein